MAEWKLPAEVSVDNDLDQLWADLERDVLSNPAFAEIVGLDAEQLRHHAARVVAQYIATRSGEGVTALLNPEYWMLLYTMGFVVGTRYGRSNPL